MSHRAHLLATVVGASMAWAASTLPIVEVPFQWERIDDEVANRSRYSDGWGRPFAPPFETFARDSGSHSSHSTTRALFGNLLFVADHDYSFDDYAVERVTLREDARHGLTCSSDAPHVPLREVLWFRQSLDRGVLQFRCQPGGAEPPGTPPRRHDSFSVRATPRRETLAEYVARFGAPRSADASTAVLLLTGWFIALAAFTHWLIARRRPAAREADPATTPYRAPTVRAASGRVDRSAVAGRWALLCALLIVGWSSWWQSRVVPRASPWPGASPTSLPSLEEFGL